MSVYELDIIKFYYLGVIYNYQHFLTRTKGTWNGERATITYVLSKEKSLQINVNVQIFQHQRKYLDF